MPVIPKIERVRVLAIESPSALDCFENRTESNTLHTVCKLLNHEFASTIVRSQDEFATALKHATSINPSQIPVTERSRPLCLHIAAHGSKSGITLGADHMRWNDLGNSLWTFFQDMDHYPGPLILVISACCAGNQQLTNVFQAKAKTKSKPKPPAYVITTVGDNDGDVYWADSVVAWSIFYHQIGKAVLHSRSDIQLILDKIKLVGAGSLKYFRWDSSKKSYYHYESTVEEHSKQAAAFKAGSNGKPTASTKPTAKPRPSRR